MVDEQLRRVFARMDAEDEADRAAGLDSRHRSLAIGPESGRLLSALAAVIPACRALELGASRGYSSLWIAAGCRVSGGTVASLELLPEKAAAWRANLAEAGLDDVATLHEGDAFATLETLPGPFDLVLLDAWKDDYEALFALARARTRRGGIIVADNVVSHDGLAGYVAARQGDPGLSSVTVPTGSGLELTTVL
jgi:predicted O-methyltransferase YrrM